jgi:phage baseplate assembly protein W
MSGLSPKLPLSTDDIDGYTLIKSYNELVAQNLKNLVLTAPGERMMDPTFGVGIRNYLFEPNTPETHQIIAAKISKQVSKYMPFLKVKTVFLSPREDVPDIELNAIEVQIKYFVKPLNMVDILNITVDQTN